MLVVLVRVTQLIEFKLSTSVLMPLNKDEVLAETLHKGFLVSFRKIFSGEVNRVTGLKHLAQLKEISSISK